MQWAWIGFLNTGIQGNTASALSDCGQMILLTISVTESNVWESVDRGKFGETYWKTAFCWEVLKRTWRLKTASLTSLWITHCLQGCICTGGTNGISVADPGNNWLPPIGGAEYVSRNPSTRYTKGFKPGGRRCLSEWKQEADKNYKHSRWKNWRELFTIWPERYWSDIKSAKNANW